MKMKKKLLSRKTFLILKTLYVSICLSGLSWQVITISINFFKFDVVSTISTKLPGKENAKAINICLDVFDSLNVEEYKRIMEDKLRNVKGMVNKSSDDILLLKNMENHIRLINNRRLSVTQRYGVMRSSSEYFLTVEDFFNFKKKEIINCAGVWENTAPAEFEYTCNLTKFIINNEICYRIVPKHKGLFDKHISFLLRKIDRIFSVGILYQSRQSKTIRILLNDVKQLPWNEVIEAKRLKQFKNMSLSAYTFDISKQSAPYRDNCKNYEPQFIDRNDAVACCINDWTIKNMSKVSTVKLILPGSEHGNYSVQNFDPMTTDLKKRGEIIESLKIVMDTTLSCREKYSNPDCDTRITFTEIENPPPRNEIYNSTCSGCFQTFHQYMSDSVSYNIQSSPKTEHIDYVTFVFGCLGTWLGFSFLGIQPVDFLFIDKTRTTDSKADPVEKKLRILNRAFENYRAKSHISQRHFIIKYEEIENLLKNSVTKIDRLETEIFLIRNQTN